MDSALVCQDISLLRRGWEGSQHAVLKSVSAVFKAGQVAIISGSTGAGKSTLLHILAGLMRPSQGQILADNRPVSRWNTAHRDRWRRKVGIVFQHPRLLNELTVLENVILPIIPRVGSIARLRQRGETSLIAGRRLPTGVTRPTALVVHHRRRDGYTIRSEAPAPRPPGL